MHQTEVLLVEDSATDALLVGAHLRSDGRFGVSHVRRLSDACHRLSNGDSVDVVILDLNLPDSTGLETFTSLHRQFPNMPIVILSNDEDEALAIAAVRKGAQDYVPKSSVAAPLLMRSLLYAIERNRRLLAENRNEAIELDLAGARQIQQHLLPSHPPHVEGFDIAGVCHPAEACGGDFFDFIELDNGKWGMLVADVSSHGFGPALIMVGARRMIRTCALLHDDLGAILAIVNRAVCEDTLAEQFVTLFYACIDPSTGMLSYAAAGHPAWLIGCDGESTMLESASIPLGLQPDTVYEVAGTHALKRGEMVLLMTDGVWEAHSPDGDYFGQQRVFDLLDQHRDQPASVIVERLLDTLKCFCHPLAFVDDVTIVLVKVAEP